MPTVDLHVRPTARRIPKGIVDALDQAKAILTRAETAASEITSQAGERATALAQVAAKEAVERETARLAAQHIALDAALARAKERDINDIAAVALALAERLVRNTIAAEPESVVRLAEELLQESRSIVLVIEAHPDDAAMLATKREQLGLSPHARVESNAQLGRGDLIVRTELGAMRAMLRTRIEQLAEAAREFMYHADNR